MVQRSETVIKADVSAFSRCVVEEYQAEGTVVLNDKVTAGNIKGLILCFKLGQGCRFRQFCQAVIEAGFKDGYFSNKSSFVRTKRKM